MGKIGISWEDHKIHDQQQVKSSSPEVEALSQKLEGLMGIS